ncbi:SDR family oxidoreductase [Paracidovorax avenae]|nr:SDR family oxidoreductase [Paracidovorax avenae]
MQGDRPVMHGLGHIIAAMQKAGVRRLIQVGPGLDAGAHPQPQGWPR